MYFTSIICVKLLLQSCCICSKLIQFLDNIKICTSKSSNKYKVKYWIDIAEYCCCNYTMVSKLYSNEKQRNKRKKA